MQAAQLESASMFGWLANAVMAFEWQGQHLLWGVLLFLASSLGGLAAVALVLVKLPATYFQGNDHPPAFPWAQRHPVLRWTALIIKNLLGIVLLILGIIQLVTPGQGVLTILIGLILLNFPGKRRLLRKLVSQPRVLRSINRLRERFGKPPLVLDDEPDRQQTAAPT